MTDRQVPRWVKEGTFDEEWEDAPERGETVQIRVEFTEDLDAGAEVGETLGPGSCGGGATFRGS